MHKFAIESYGVRFCVQSNSKREIERARSVLETTLVGLLREIDPALADHQFFIRKTKDRLFLEIGDDNIGDFQIRKGFYHYFGTRVKVLVAEFAVDHVFVHAGVIGWKGNGVLFPADSHEGKSTLIAALIKLGATYYSDDYAILDKNGLVHPFPRRLSIRDRNRPGEWSNVSAATFGAETGSTPLPVRAVIITNYRENARWKPKVLTPGIGLLEIIPFTIPLQANPESSITILRNAVSRAIIAKSSRPEIEFCVAEILGFVDKSLK